MAGRRQAGSTSNKPTQRVPSQGPKRGGQHGQQRVQQSHARANQRKHTQSSATKGEPSIIEGRRACAEALEVGIPLRRVLVASGDASLASLVARFEAATIPVEEVARHKLDALSSHGAHQGIMCQAAPYQYVTLDDIIKNADEKNALVVVLDHVTDQGNLGAIVRSAEVVGAAGVVIAKARAAGVDTGAYKTSAGAVMHVPIAQVSNIPAALERLKEAGFWIGAASEHAEQDVWSAPLDGRLVLVMGAEGTGISRLVREHCDFTCRLPQRGQVESLNVAQAATVMCYEWLRRLYESSRGD